MSLRIAVKLKVTIEFPPRHEANRVTGVTEDLCFDGGFVRHGGKVLPKSTLARVALTDAAGETIVIDALVLRSSEAGTALLFADYGDVLFERLADLLKSDFAGYLDSRRTGTSPLLPECTVQA